MARTSLRLPLGLLREGFESGSHVVFYAGVPGALVDLAADAAFVLGRDGIVLDARPVTTVPDHGCGRGGRADGHRARTGC